MRHKVLLAVSRWIALIGVAAIAASPPQKLNRARPIGAATTAQPGLLPGGGADLPNGWRITPAGKAIAEVNDLVLKMVVSPDGTVIVAGHGG